MHKFTLAFLPVLLYIVLSTDAVRRFPADAVCRSDNRNNKSIIHISNGGNENERKSSSCVFRRT